MTKVTIHPAIRTQDGSEVGQEFTWSERTPHWRKFGSGGASLQILGSSHGNVSVIAEEWYENDGGKLVGKKTMLDLDRAGAEALRDLLNRILGGSSREARTLIGYPRINSVSPEPKPVGRADKRHFSVGHAEAP